MPARDTYLLHIYRSRTVGGWQWCARLEHLMGGEHARFADPEALLAYLGTIVRTGEPPVLPTNPAPRRADPPIPIEVDGTSRRG